MKYLEFLKNIEYCIYISFTLIKTTQSLLFSAHFFDSRPARQNNITITDFTLYLYEFSFHAFNY